MVDDERVEKRCEAFVRAIVQRTIIESKMLFARALKNKNNHIFRLEGGSIVWRMYGREKC